MTESIATPPSSSPALPPYDPELLAVLEAAPPLRPVTLDGIGEFRAGMTVLSNEELAEGGGVVVEEREVPVEGEQPAVPLVVLRPERAAGAGPLLINVHGGGLMGGTARGLMSYCRHWVRDHGVTIVSVEYRLAPEHPYPAAHTDVLRAVRHVTGHAADFGTDPQRVLLGGVSAGGGLVLGVALRLRDEGGPGLAGVMALTPMIDDRNDSVAVRQTEESAVWGPTSNRTGWRAYLGEAAGGPDVEPYAAPARATDLSGLPPLFLDVGSAEAFRSEVVDLADRVWAASGDCELHVWPGGCHAYEVWAPHTRIGRGTTAVRDDWAMARLGVEPPG